MTAAFLGPVDLGLRGWHLGANDDTLGGWLITAAYVVLACLCWSEVARQRSMPRTRNQTLPPSFWFGLAVVVTVLGINKQLDFQSLLRGAGRQIALAQGFLPYVRSIQAGFAAAAAIGGILVLRLMWRLARNATRREQLVLLGTAAMLGFVLFRIGDLNHINEVVGGIRFRHRPLVATELAILAFFCVAVWRNRMRSEASLLQ